MSGECIVCGWIHRGAKCPKCAMLQDILARFEKLELLDKNGLDGDEMVANLEKSIVWILYAEKNKQFYSEKARNKIDDLIWIASRCSDWLI